MEMPYWSDILAPLRDGLLWVRLDIQARLQDHTAWGCDVVLAGKSGVLYELGEDPYPQLR